MFNYDLFVEIMALKGSKRLFALQLPPPFELRCKLSHRCDAYCLLSTYALDEEILDRPFLCISGRFIDFGEVSEHEGD
jgi:hypothetical protein